MGLWLARIIGPLPSLSPKRSQNLPSKEKNRLRPAFVAVKGKFLDRLARFERVKSNIQELQLFAALCFWGAFNESESPGPQVIGYGDCVEWPPRSPDLNPLDFLLWGYIKQRVYATLLPTLKELRILITDVCASVSPAMLYNVQREVQSRVQMCIVAEGHHFEHGR
ncbi:hypothetical protein AVEN_171403-1 [Araneus ventricosus]|uniref:Uncharacterized protein n=1 Tax=Araneus ventricosus TaxID=182803 RepID=A0A4Y2K8P2_ARAVE|nr:hypothetical protein AVEN_20353-1 [Araneus ventricosus]GBM98674.1 hypothetical protein AVEN_171403-1 [Araneus ventricosus]